MGGMTAGRGPTTWIRRVLIVLLVGVLVTTVLVYLGSYTLQPR